jgi:hypothetical protein
LLAPLVGPVLVERNQVQALEGALNSGTAALSMMEKAAVTGLC